MDDLELVSRHEKEPFKDTGQSKRTSMEVDISLPKLCIIFNAYDYDKDPYGNELRNSLFLVLEGVGINYYMEEEPIYSEFNLHVDNFFIKDVNSPLSTMPYFLQTIYINEKTARDPNAHALSLSLFFNPKEDKRAHFKIKIFTLAQIYIYSNLSYVANILKIYARFIKERIDIEQH